MPSWAGESTSLHHLAVGGGSVRRARDANPGWAGLPLDILLARQKDSSLPQKPHGCLAAKAVCRWLQLERLRERSGQAGRLEPVELGRLEPLAGRLEPVSWAAEPVSGRGSILVSRRGLRSLSRLAGCGLTRRGRGGLLREGRQCETTARAAYDESVFIFNFLRMGEHCWLHSSTPYGRVAFFLRP